MITIASYGGGTNSTAGIIDRVNNGLPIDLTLFADTGGERPETYQFIRQFSGWLMSKGYPGVYKVAHFETLEEECLRESRLPSKAFGFGSCSDKFKIRVQRRYVKKWKPVVDAWERGEEIQSLVFYDAGEPHRAQNQKKEKGIVKIFPLIEAGINRDGCKQIIDDAGFCQPGKSSCWFCPSMKKNEIKKLEAGHPDLMERALEIERRGVETLTELNNGVAPSGSSVMGLGRHFSWETFLRQGDLFPEIYQDQYMEEACGCYDG